MKAVCLENRRFTVTRWTRQRVGDNALPAMQHNLIPPTPRFAIRF